MHKCLVHWGMHVKCQEQSTRSLCTTAWIDSEGMCALTHRHTTRPASKYTYNPSCLNDTLEAVWVSPNCLFPIMVEQTSELPSLHTAPLPSFHTTLTHINCTHWLCAHLTNAEQATPVVHKLQLSRGERLRGSRKERGFHPNSPHDLRSAISG